MLREFFAGQLRVASNPKAISANLNFNPSRIATRGRLSPLAALLACALFTAGGPLARAADCNTNGTNDSLEFDCNGNGQPDICDVVAGAPDANTNGTPDSCEIALSGVLIVDSRAPAGGNGRSWARPMQQLYTAIAAAISGEQIWVARGSYKPTVGADRTISFALKENVKLYGGFKGGEMSIAQRDWRQNITTLTGDLLGNDGPNYTNMADNSWHVLNCLNTGNWTVDGFTVTAGRASETLQEDGAGIMVNAGGRQNISIRNCVFLRNNGDRSGAAMLGNVIGPLIVQDCRFLGNLCDPNQSTASGGGAGISAGGSATVLKLINCEFSGNTCTKSGGALYVNCPTELYNCTVGQNGAGINGGGIFNNGTSITIRNSVLYGNTGGGGQSAQLFGFSGTWTVSHSCIQNNSSFIGSGNTSVNPQFVSPLGADTIVGTRDDDLRLGVVTACVEGGDNSVIPAGVIVDLAGSPRVAEGNVAAPATVDMGAHEFHAAGLPDCNTNGYADASDVGEARSMDVTPAGGDGIPDECQLDCNTNGTPDAMDIAQGEPDCDTNQLPDVCTIQDCNTNDRPDACDTAIGASHDCIANGTPDECDGDCDGNCILDSLELSPQPFSDVSTNLSPFFISSVSHTIVGAPTAVGTVTLSFTSLRDFANLQYVAVAINNVSVGQVAWTPAGGGVCRTQNGVLQLPSTTFNGLVNSGNAVITMTPVAQAFANCMPSYIRVTTSYSVPAAASDCNANGVLDVCDRRALGAATIVDLLLGATPPAGAACLFDMNGDGRIDGDDIGLFTAAVIEN